MSNLREDNAAQQAPLLEIRGLRTHFFTEAGVARAVDGVDLTIGPGEVVGLVGESGSGKSVTALSILRLIPSPPAVGGRTDPPARPPIAHVRSRAGPGAGRLRA